MMGFDTIIYFPSVLQAAQFESLQFILWYEEIEECCLSCPITVILPLLKKERLERSAEKVSQ